LVPWFAGTGGSAAVTSLAIGIAAAAVVGGLVARFAEKPLWYGVVRQVLIVIVACGVTYFIGELVGINLA
ncbi:MAG: hypothetical protein ACO23O_14710, partial [Ilumatobacteraceae bacterium]